MTQHPATRRSRRRKVAATAGTVGLLAAAVGYFLGWFGAGGWGPGGQNGQAGPDDQTPEASRPLTPEDLSRPVTVEVRGHEYYILERKVELSRVVELVGQVPADEGARGATVIIRRAPSSRASAEEKLTDQLQAAGVRFVMETPPGT